MYLDLGCQAVEVIGFGWAVAHSCDSSAELKLNFQSFGPCFVVFSQKVKLPVPDPSGT